MTAQEAYNRLNPKRWGNTSITERLHLLEEVRGNMKTYVKELAQADNDMKNNIMGEDLFSDGVGMMGTAVPIANTLTACIHLYESLLKGKMPEPENVIKVKADIYDIELKPFDAKERLMAGSQKFHLRVKGEPKQTNPMEQPIGVTAVLGAGNYSSSLEMVKAMFLDNKCVIHKPHHLNEKTDAVWEKIFKPLVDHGALSFCDSDQGRTLTTLEGISKIYFTGGTGTAKAIMNATSTPLISECGGNNPCIIVPGDRPWTQKEIDHQALQIATMGKLNGGAVCGRPQTIVTSKHWSQREAFLNALRKAIKDETPAAGTYYPGSDDVKKKFVENHDNVEVIKPENGKYKNADFMLITNVEEDGFAVKNEAFTQILDEVPLDVPANAKDFLPKAVEFCNTKLLGTLGSCILIDEDTKKNHKTSLDQALTDMNYGGIAVNTMPPFIFLSPYLTWGGNEEGQEFVSGIGNFGNAYCFENIEKSILEDKFMSPGHMLVTNKKAFDHVGTNMANFAIAPTWMNMTKIMGTAVVDSFRKKDF